MEKGGAAINGFFDQVKQRLNDGMSGGEAFRYLLRLISAQFGTQDRGDSSSRLNAFGVANGTTLTKFLQLSRVAVSNVTNCSSLLSPDDGWIVEITWNKVNDQFPSMLTSCFPRKLATVDVPHGSLEEMWAAFDDVSTNKIMAVNGNHFGTSLSYAEASMPKLSLQSPGGGRSNRRSAFSSANSNSSRRSRNPVFMTVRAEKPHDVLWETFQAWPLASDEHWETVFNISGTGFKKLVPPLWTPLYTGRSRQAFNKDVALNCTLYASLRHALHQR